MRDRVILVDGKDREIGTADKLEAHVDGLLHRAFSVFIFNERGEVLLQRRHPDKYHSGGLWSNTCCSHPRPGEAVLKAATRRLLEEMGMRCTLEASFCFRYRVRLESLWEHEIDHVLLGYCDDSPIPHPDEVSGWRWANADMLSHDLRRRPDHYTYWFRRIYERARSRAHARKLSE